MIMYVFAFAFGLLLTSMFDPTIFFNFSSSHVKSNAWQPGPNTRSVLKNYLDMAGNRETLCVKYKETAIIIVPCLDF